MKVPISEIYIAVQGEGQHSTPAVFVRFWGCNLRCSFNENRCDTPYAVFEGEKTFMNVEQIFSKIINFNIQHIVFTGGEPLLFQEIIEYLLHKLPFYFVEIETNGTIEINEYLKRRIDQFNISPKLSSSNQWKGYEDKRINMKALSSFPTSKSIFKFVVNSEQDINEIKEISKINPFIKVYLMPQGETREQIINNIPLVLDLCLRNKSLEHNYGFINRNHILAYNKERGV